MVPRHRLEPTDCVVLQRVLPAVLHSALLNKNSGQVGQTEQKHLHCWSLVKYTCFLPNHSLTLTFIILPQLGPPVQQLHPEALPTVSRPSSRRASGQHVVLRSV